MAKRESYLRVVMTREGREYIAGLEWRQPEDLVALQAALKMRMKVATTHIEYDRWDDLAMAIEKTIKTYWPDRAYFIEVGDDRHGWVQLFQPYGLPREAA